MSYYDLALARNAERHVRIVDLYAYVVAERSSRLMRRELLPRLRELWASGGGKLTPASRRALRELDACGKLAVLVEGAQPREALRPFDEPPQEVRKDRSILALRLRAAKQLGARSPEYARATRELAEAARGDPGACLMLLEAAAVRSDHDAVLKHAADFERLIAPDAPLCAIRANTYIWKGQYDAAMREADRGIGLEPTLIHCYWSLADAAKAKKDWAATCAALSRIDRRFPGILSPAAIEGIDGMKEFTASAEYRQWKLQRAGGVSKP